MLVSDDVIALSIHSLVSRLTAGSQWLVAHASDPPTGSCDWLRCGRAIDWSTADNVSVATRMCA